MVVSNALIGLREGLEAALVVVILLAFLVKTGRRWAVRYVWLGIAVAVVLSVLLGAVLTFGTSRLSFEAQELVGGLASVVAVGFVTAMVFWMRAAASTISGQLKGRLDNALDVGPWAVVLVAVLGVGREGLETAIFFYATTQAAGAGNVVPMLGWLMGIGGAVLLGVAMYQGALRINLGRFFRWTGVLLVLVAAGILGYGIHDLQEAGALPGLTTLAFDVSAVVDPSSWYAALLKGIFNVTPQTTVLQAVAWVLYVGIVLPLFLRRPRVDKPAPRVEATAGLTFAAQKPRRKETGMPLDVCALSRVLPVAVIVLGACSGTGPSSPASSSAAAPGRIGVQAGDRTCSLSVASAPTGVLTFDVTNSGSNVTEFYVYAEGGRILGEVENISPGLTRQLQVQVTDPTTLTTACKPGMVGDGIRSTVTVTRETVPGSGY